MVSVGIHHDKAWGRKSINKRIESLQKSCIGKVWRKIQGTNGNGESREKQTCSNGLKGREQRNRKKGEFLMEEESDTSAKSINTVEPDGKLKVRETCCVVRFEVSFMQAEDIGLELINKVLKMWTSGLEAPQIPLEKTGHCCAEES